MLRRGFYIFLALIAAFLLYDIYRAFSSASNITKVKDGYYYGPADADLTVYEFLDYSCQFCQDIHPTIIKAVNEDGNVKLVPRPLISQNRESVYNSLLAYAAGKQDKFLDVHNIIIEDFQPLTEERLIDIANRTELDLTKINEDMNSASIRERMRQNNVHFQSLGGQSTPFFLIGDMTFVPENQMPNTADFLQLFQQAREQNP